MKKNGFGVGIVLGLAVALTLSGCNGQKSVGEATAAVQPRSIVLREGTPIDLFLTKEVSSDQSAIGEVVNFVVGQNVASQIGATAIPAGTTASGKVVQSRRAGALSGIMNQPARLEIELDPIKLPNGQTVTLFDRDGESATYSFNAGNTGASDNSRAKTLESLTSESSRKLLEELSAAIDSGQIPPDLGRRLSEDPEIKRLLNQAMFQSAKTWTDRKTSVDEGLDSLLKATAEARKGRLDSIPTSEIGLALAAIGELTSVAEDFGSALKGVFKGRNIRAHIGTVVHAKVAQTVEWTEIPKVN